jgi:hydrogenase-4 membrane subunit HyfE
MWSDWVVVFLVCTSILLLLTWDWRWSIAALVVQYLGVFLLVSISWPMGMSLIKLVVGWMAGAALGLTRMSQVASLEKQFPKISSRVFQMIAACLVLIAVFSITPKLQEWLPGVRSQQVLGSFILITIGLLHLGMTRSPFRVIIGLLTILSGFEILYAAVEISLLVAGLLAGVNLGLASIGIYLLSNMPTEEVV